MELVSNEIVVKKESKIKKYFKAEGKKFKKNKSIMWFVLPAIILSLVFAYLPMVGVLFSFKADMRPAYWMHDFFCSGCDNYYCGQTGFDTGWTLAHYAAIFKDATFIKAVGNTLQISGLKLIIIFPLTIIFAIMLSEIKSQKLSKLVLILACLPNFISWPVALGIFENIFAQQNGLLNNLLYAINNNHVQVDYFSEWYLFLVIFFAAWKSIGWGSIMYYAAIVSIDKSYYEAATLDGASKLQKIRYLTIPSLVPLIALMLVMNITYIMDAGFDQIYTMLKMIPSMTNDYQILGTYIFRLIESGEPYPFTVALSVFNGLIALSLMLGGNGLVKKFLNQSLW